MKRDQIHPILKPTIVLFIYCSMTSILYGQEQTALLKSNKEVAISYINEVVNNRKINLIGEFFSPAYVFHGMDGKDTHNIADSSLVSFLKYLFKAFPDLHYDIENVIAENSMVALNLSATGTHKEEFLGYKASDNKVVFKEMFFFRLSNKKIVEGWGVVDVDGLTKQISKK